MAKYLDYTGLTYFTNKIKLLFAPKDVATTDANGLMSADDKDKLDKIDAGAQKNPSVASATASGLMSSDDWTKLNGIDTGAEVNVITSIKRNSVTVSPATDKSVNITVPTAVSDLTNDSGFQTSSDVQALISQAGHMNKSIVQTLPTTGADNIIYLVPVTGSTGNIYDEFLWINSKWEKIGDTDTHVSLEGYLQSTDLVAITNTEIDALYAED